MGCVTLCFFSQVYLLSWIQFAAYGLARILQGITATRGMFLGMALNGTSLKELLAALGDSVDSNLLSDLQICHCNFHLSH